MVELSPHNVTPEIDTGRILECVGKAREVAATCVRRRGDREFFDADLFLDRMAEVLQEQMETDYLFSSFQIDPLVIARYLLCCIWTDSTAATFGGRPAS